VRKIETRILLREECNGYGAGMKGMIRGHTIPEAGNNGAYNNGSFGIGVECQKMYNELPDVLEINRNSEL
jgi:hypothetical protein